MSKIVLDTSAWIEYYAGTDRGRQVHARITDQNAKVFTTGLIVAELAAKFLRESKSAGEVINSVGALASLVPSDFRLGEEAAEIYVQQRRIRGKFSLVDAHAVAAARLVGGKVITCDHDFSGLREVVVIR